LVELQSAALVRYAYEKLGSRFNALWLHVLAIESAGRLYVAGIFAIDFWLGHWRVTNARSKVVGYDDVTKRLDRRVVFEEYRDAVHPSLGISMTAYEAGRGQWHQDFMDDSGFVLALDGSLQNGKILNGTDYVDGKPRLNRGVWARRGDEVEELWIFSLDGGRTWKTQFDGLFHHVARPLILQQNAFAAGSHKPYAGARSCVPAELAAAAMSSSSRGGIFAAVLEAGRHSDPLSGLRRRGGTTARAAGGITRAAPSSGRLVDVLAGLCRTGLPSGTLLRTARSAEPFHYGRRKQL
jgi:hypothetical protein